MSVFHAPDLYALPLERFVAERAALAKGLRAEGERERASGVAKLRKPSVAAWAVNQLVRTQRRMVDELFESGDQLDRAQSELLAGRGDGDALRKAGEREHTAVQRLTDAARGLLSSQRHEISALTLERVRETLHAGALDQEARAEIREGCLVRELRHVGLGGSGLPSVAAERGAVKSSRAGGRTARGADSARRGLGDQAERGRGERLKAARKAAAEARRTAERAERELRDAQERRDRAADALEQAEARLADARHRSEQAALAQRRTQQALTQPPG